MLSPRARFIKLTLGDLPSRDPAGPPADRVVTLAKAPICLDARLVVAQTFWSTVNPFSTAKKGNTAKWYVDGAELMANMAADIAAAEQYVYITDWALNPNIPLIRAEGSADDNSTISNLLKTLLKKRSNVEVRILLYDSVEIVEDNHDIEVEEELEKLHPQIRVLRHRWHACWSHHQKTMIIDGKIGYIGGIDLYDGRWDNHHHHVDWQGRDEFALDRYNPCISDEEKLLLGSRFPRMPWHDVHLRLTGPSVADIQNNFVERWNDERVPLLGESKIAPPAPAARADGTHTVQIIRSAWFDSIGTVHGVQANIHEAYIKGIQGAQDYIYIENQFFATHCDSKGSPTYNVIGDELMLRIFKAIECNETFRVYVVLPIHPEGNLDQPTPRELLYWQYFGISRSEKSLLNRIDSMARQHGKTAEDYIFFASLRAYSTPSPINRRAYTEQIYVHSKLMIIDDRVVIIGSANINDRSLLGTRDTELSAIVIDNDLQSARLNGKMKRVRKFAHTLRMRLWREHLGIWKDDSKIADPVLDSTYKDVWIKTAKKNTEIFEHVFPRIPSNKYKTQQEMVAAKRYVHRNLDLLQGVQGHLVCFPHDFLSGQGLDSFVRPNFLLTDEDPLDPNGVGIA